MPSLNLPITFIFTLEKKFLKNTEAAKLSLNSKKRLQLNTEHVGTHLI